MNNISVIESPLVVADQATKKMYTASSISLLEKVTRMKQEGKTWEIIDVLVEAWIKHAEEKDQGDFDAYTGYLQDARENQRDRRFGKTKNQDQDRRYLLSIPVKLMTMIRGVFSPTELIMDKEFFLDFARRYPLFKIPEKL